MNDYVNVKKGENILKLRIDKNTTELLSRIFKLKLETIYLIGEDSVIMPDPSTGEINNEDVLSYVTYEVFGDPLQQHENKPQPQITQPSTFQLAQPGPSGIQRLASLSYPLSAVGTMSSSMRPSHASCASVSRLPSQQNGSPWSGNHKKPWRRTIVFCEVENGLPSPIYQVFLTLNINTASLESVAEQVEKEVGTAVVLLDNKYLPIKSSENTRGK